MPVRVVPVSFDDPRAIAMRAVLDEDLNARYTPLRTPGEPDEVGRARTEALRTHADHVVQTWIALDEDDVPLGHVLLRRLGGDCELKRLLVVPAARRRGVAKALTAAVIARAREEGADRVILQTGPAQPESLALYAAAGFQPIPVYEPYVATMPNSLCFALDLR